MYAAQARIRVQRVYGAFMAGTRAGHVAATFPDMNGRYAPSSFFTGVLARDLLDNPLSIHYLHRVLAFVLLAHAIATLFALRTDRSALRLASYVYLGAVAGQIVLGALTVVLHMPIPVAVAHQGGAYVVFSAALMLCHAAAGAGAVSPTQPTQPSTDADGGEAGWAVKLGQR